jgi:hypothetical protein
MKALILVTMVALSTMGILSGCDKPDYQDPRYRTSHK